MNLLFKKEGANGSTELKELLGFIHADIKFESIRPDIITATNELIRLIGQSLYDSLMLTYLKENPTDEEKHLLYVVRYPIAIRAYMLFVPNNDIAHTPNGRKMKGDENEKHAFEWMIDKDNEALERRYYRSLDDMLIYLDAANDVWRSSEAFKKTHRLFLRTADDYNEYFQIESRLLLLKLEPGMRQCEQNEILPRIGRVKYNELKNILQAGNIVSDTDRELLELINEAVAYHALAWAMPRLSVTLFPEGVLQKYTSDRSTNQIKRPAAGMETDAAKMAFANDAAKVLLKIEKLVAPAPEPVPDCENETPKIITGSNFISL